MKWWLWSGMATLLLTAPGPGYSLESDAALQAAKTLLRDGDPQQALVVVNEYLRADPAAGNARFLKGLILAELGDTDGAITIYSALTLDSPRTPEPFNNLAVMYVQKGAYSLALAALRKALEIDPAYVTAHENLGDLYLRLAARSYASGLRIDSTNPVLAAKLTSVRQVVPGAP